MVVVGAARSGIAAAELLAKRGAIVTLTEARDSFDGMRAFARRRRAARAGRSSARDAGGGGSGRRQPGRAARAAGVRCPARSRRRDHRRARAGLAMDPRPRAWRSPARKGSRRRRRCSDGCSTAAGRSVLVGGNIGVPLSAQVEASTAGDDSRRRDEQLSARDHHDVPSVDRGLAELRRRPPGSASDRRGVRGGEGADLRQPDGGGLGGRQRGRPGGRRAQRDGARAQGGVRALGTQLPRASSSTASGSSGAPAPAGSDLFPIAAVELTGRHMLNNVLAARRRHPSPASRRRR